MHRRATDADAVLERRALGLEGRKCRQQRGMNIEDAAWKRRQQRVADQTHESGEAHEIDPARLQFLYQGAVIVVAVLETGGAYMKRFDSRIPRALQSRRRSAVGDHDGYRRVEFTRANGVDDRLQVRPTARNEDGESRAHA